ncbi:hypothetical protein [Streptomyces sp. cmx-4-9]|uniref:hypothetical protein n=1 Tax=Streptomyces sp. cmx-4-9 TaxID=2790941 RepID=UPI00397F2652
MSFSVVAANPYAELLRDGGDYRAFCRRCGGLWDFTKANWGSDARHQAEGQVAIHRDLSVRCRSRR